MPKLAAVHQPVVGKWIAGRLGCYESDVAVLAVLRGWRPDQAFEEWGCGERRDWRLAGASEGRDENERICREEGHRIVVVELPDKCAEW